MKKFFSLAVLLMLVVVFVAPAVAAQSDTCECVELVNVDALMAAMKDVNFITAIKCPIPTSATLEFYFQRYAKRVRADKFTIIRKSACNLIESRFSVTGDRKYIVDENQYVGIYSLLAPAFCPPPDPIYNGYVVFHIELCGGQICEAWWKNEIAARR